MNKIRTIAFTTLALVFSVLGLASTPYATSYASTPGDKVTEGFEAAGGDSNCKTKADGTNSCSIKDTVQTITNVLLFVLGAIAVIMIIVGGIRYVISDGDSTRIKSAKDTILYSVIGLIVALMAYAIVSFVITQFVN